MSVYGHLVLGIVIQPRLVVGVCASRVVNCFPPGSVVKRSLGGIDRVGSGVLVHLIWVQP